MRQKFSVVWWSLCQHSFGSCVCSSFWKQIFCWALLFKVSFRLPLVSGLIDTKTELSSPASDLSRERCGRLSPTGIFLHLLHPMIACLPCSGRWTSAPLLLLLPHRCAANIQDKPAPRGARFAARSSYRSSAVPAGSSSSSSSSSGRILLMKEETSSVSWGRSGSGWGPRIWPETAVLSQACASREAAAAGFRREWKSARVSSGLRAAPRLS